MLRHSTGAKEEFLAPQVNEETAPIVLQGKDTKMLGIYFALMVFVGLGNKIFNKLQTIPMHSESSSNDDTSVSLSTLISLRLSKLSQLAHDEHVCSGGASLLPRSSHLS
jgi:hypothetical protein